MSMDKIAKIYSIKEIIIFYVSVIIKVTKEKATLNEQFFWSSRKKYS